MRDTPGLWNTFTHKNRSNTMIMCLSNVNGAVSVGMRGMRGRMFLSALPVAHVLRVLSIRVMVNGVSLGVACLTRMMSHLLTMMGILSFRVGVNAGTLIASTKRM